jgi:hypothetical protein
MSIEGSGLNVFFGPNGAGGGLDPGPWQSPAWTFSCWLKTPTWTYDGSDASIDGTAGIQINAESRSILLEWGTLVDSGLVVEGHGWIENDDGGIVSFDWHPDTWYELRWYYNFETGDSWVKAWVVGFTEPDWLVTDSTYGGLGGDVQPKWFRIRSLSTLFTPWNSGNPELVRFENFAFTTCEVAPPAAGEETPVSGEIIEDQTITSSTVTLGSPFVPGSTTLWVDGTLETDYTEDPTAGQITIGFAITTTLHVKVRYTVA